MADQCDSVVLPFARTFTDVRLRELAQVVASTKNGLGETIFRPIDTDAMDFLVTTMQCTENVLGSDTECPRDLRVPEATCVQFHDALRHGLADKPPLPIPLRQPGCGCHVLLPF